MNHNREYDRITKKPQNRKAPQSARDGHTMGTMEHGTPHVWGNMSLRGTCKEGSKSNQAQIKATSVVLATSASSVDANCIERSAFLAFSAECSLVSESRWAAAAVSFTLVASSSA